MTTDRADFYDNRIRNAERRGRTSEVLYLDGNFMLDLAARHALDGTEQNDLIDNATETLHEAARLAGANGDLGRYYRIHTMLPFAKMMVYAPVINTTALTPAQSRHIKKEFNLADIYRETCETAQNTLDAFEYLRNRRSIDQDQAIQQQQLIGLLEEQTLLALGMYAQTPLECITPSLQFDDAYGDEDQRIDAIAWDNRRNRTHQARGIQVKHTISFNTISRTDQDILLVESWDLGNDFASTQWFGEEIDFMTLRILINHGAHGAYSRKHAANIERIRRDLFKKAETPDRAALYTRLRQRHRHGSASLKFYSPTDGQIRYTG